MTDPDIRTTHENAIAEVTTGQEFTPWINGQGYRPSDGDTIDTVDPAANLTIAEILTCDATDVDVAIEAAQDAYDGVWSETSPAERGRMLREWVTILRDHETELTQLECLDTGKPIEQARGEVRAAFDTIEYYASLCRGMNGTQIPTGNNVHAYTRKEPYGVVGQIIPWNFPLWSVTWKLGPALAAGNTSVLKPAPDAPLTAIRAIQLSSDVFPDGVVNVITGAGHDVGNALTNHENIQKLSFTGSRKAGELVMKSAANHIAPVTLELGSKSPFLVFPDADLEKVSQAVADGIFYSTGEICDAFSRAIIHEDIYEEFVDEFLSSMDQYTLGDPLDVDTMMGPLTTADQYESVQNYVELGQEEGATLLRGGDTPDGRFEHGWYVEPTVFTDVDNDMRIAQEEIFGPIQTIQSFSTYEEGIELANNTRYGLSAGIGTERSSLIHNAAADLEAGLIYVNGYGPILPEAPYGGFKESGIGKDLGAESIEQYLQTKTVYVNLDEPTL